MKVLYLETIPNEKRVFDTTIILWRRQNRNKKLLLFASLVVCFVLFFSLLILSQPPREDTHFMYFPLVMNLGVTTWVPYPTPTDRLGNSDDSDDSELLLMFTTNQINEVYLPYVARSY